MRHIRIYEDFNSSEINTIDDLFKKLDEYDISYDSWGKGEAKKIENLFDEVKEKECHIKDEGGKLVRYIEFVGVRIFYTDKNGVRYSLKEDRQVFKDGRARKRTMQASVSEKMKSGEDPQRSAIRGVEEELGFRIKSDQLLKQKELSYDGGSQSYPGLNSRYRGHVFNCNLTQHQYKQEGYVERQKDKSTYFIWVKI
jgi:hypothetical protein